MNFTGPFLSAPFTEALGWALVHSLWQGTLLALVVALVSRALRRQPASTRYAVALSALALQTGAFGLTLALCYAPAAPAGGISFASALPETAAVSAPVSLKVFFENHLDTLVIGWLAGVGLLAARLLGGWALVQRWARRGARPVADSWQASLDQMRQSLGLRRAVALLESARVSVPMTVGWLKPVVLLPIGLLSGLSPRQVEAILAHELAHIQRHDFLINLIQSLADVLFFYHPAIGWLSARVRAEREHCCDDVAVALTGNRVALAQALAALETFRTLPTPALALAFGGRKTPLLDRVRRVLGGVETHSTPRQNAWVIGLCLLLAGGLAIGQSNHPPRPEASSQPVVIPDVQALAAPAPASTPIPPPNPALLLPPPPAPARPRTDTILTRAEFRRLDSLTQLMGQYLRQRKPELERLERELTTLANRSVPSANDLATQDQLVKKLNQTAGQANQLMQEIERLEQKNATASQRLLAKKQAQLAQAQAQMTAHEARLSALAERLVRPQERTVALSDSLTRLYEPITALSEQLAEASARLAGQHEAIGASVPEIEVELATDPILPPARPGRSARPVKAPRPPRSARATAASPVVAPTPAAASSPSPVAAPVPATASSPSLRPAAAPRPARSRTPAAPTPPRN